jgi:hypothetical protein
MARGTVTGRGEGRGLRAVPLLQCLLDLAGVGEAAQLFLGEDEVVPYGDLEDATAAANQLRLDAELLLDLSRQTGGTGVVVSARAVLDRDMGDRDVGGHGVLLSPSHYSDLVKTPSCLVKTARRVLVLDDFSSKRGMKLQESLLLAVRCGRGGKRDKVAESYPRGLDFIPSPEYNRERSTSL